MIGLEFICKVYDIQYKEVAQQIGVSNQTVTDWIKGKTAKIPEKRLDDLVTKIPEFKNINKSLFSKDLTPNDKQEITTLYLIQDVSNKLKKLKSKPNKEELVELKDLSQGAKEASITGLILNDLLIIAEHFSNNREFLKDLDELIFKHNPSLKEYIEDGGLN